MTYQRPDMNRGFRWQDPANLVLAVWFFFSPWILQFGSGVSTARPASGAVAINAVSNAAWDAWVLGVLVFLVALSALGRFARGQEWANLIMGAWIFVAPWALGFSFGPFPAAAWDHWIVGALIFLVSAWSLTLMRREPEERIVRSPEGHIEEAPRR
ncbi:MAG TPA: SPW repeat protein [Pseudolabrys sp.]|nr:SPW repeat protein [Pseudolabrys sp.]